MLEGSQAGLGSQAVEDRESGLDCRRVETRDKERSQAGREGRREGRRVSYSEVELRG